MRGSGVWGRRPRRESSDNRAGRGWMTQAPAALAVLALGLAAPSCSILVERDADQCDTDADCSGFPGTKCLDRVCVGQVAECQTNQECVDKHGQYFVCRKSDFQCVGLLTEQCPTIEGNYLDDGAFMIGSILPVTGDPSTGVPEENAIKLAIGDFKTTANGLPPKPGNTGRRPMVLVACSDNADQETAVVAAKHLVDDLEVPAIIGAAYSGITTRMTTEVTIPGHVLVISPSATATNITDLADDGLVWRTSPSDVYQSVALAAFIQQRLEPAIRAKLMLTAADKIKLAVLHKGDAYGAGLADALEQDPGNVQINGAPVNDPTNLGLYQRVDYGDPDNATENPPHYQDAIDAALQAKPHIIAIFGTKQAVEDVMVPIEAGWDTTGPAVTYRPRYLFADGGYIPELFAAIGADDDLRQRVSGSVPGTTNSLFSAFKNAYNSKFNGQGSPDVFGAAGSYDATYLLAYAAVANGGNPETGPNLAEGLKRMVGSPDVIDVGISKINSAFQKLSVTSSKIDFNGASGPLNFDVSTGEAPSDVQIFCVMSDANDVATTGTFSGVYLDAASLTLQGPAQFAAQCKYAP